MDVEFQALPRHILEQSFRQQDPAAFISLPFWTFDYVGLGPYRIEHWEAGAFLEATAFDGHALGRPKIDRLRLSFISDANTALANMLSGDAHYLGDFVLAYEEGQTLEREWATRGGGTVFYAPVLIRLSQIQHRPEYVSPKALLDVRVRRALAHAFDVPGALDVFTGGRGVATSTLTAPGTRHYPAVERVITKREYDRRAAQRLLEEAGMARQPDGFYASATGEPLRIEVWSTGGAITEKENGIFVDSLRRAGIDAISQVLGPARLRDAEFRALRPGLFTGGAADLDQRLAQHSISDIPKPENRWQGNNRGAWQSPEYERLWQAYNTTLDSAERTQQLAQMERLLNEDVGSIPHYFQVIVTAHSGSLQGPVARMVPDAPLTIYQVQTWTWRS
jgi:ABC-type transport system substrate-binding protein